ncbi:hypothetical protein C8Q79DRAFT_78997 [Trametes meyenii]|nr:hypothetical protein C8Q79DRAFT_78997 [Trametes meyenii]
MYDRCLHWVFPNWSACCSDSGAIQFHFFVCWRTTSERSLRCRWEIRIVQPANEVCGWLLMVASVLTPCTIPPEMSTLVPQVSSKGRVTRNRAAGEAMPKSAQSIKLAAAGAVPVGLPSSPLAHQLSTPTLSTTALAPMPPADRATHGEATVSIPVTPPSTPTRVTPPATSPDINTALHVEAVRQSLSERPQYLASPNVVALQTWHRFGNGSVITTKDMVAAYVDAKVAAGTEDNYVLEPEAVSLEVIGMISPERCFLQPDGNWASLQSNNVGWRSAFADTTLAFALVAPPAEFGHAVTDFTRARLHLEQLLKQAAERHPGMPCSGNTFARAAFPHMRLRHVVFEAKTESLEDEVEGLYAEDTVLTKDFTIDGWPTSSVGAAAALAEISSTHVTRPLPAFTADGTLIPPSQYVAMLRGATVMVRFSATHYCIGDAMKKHVFCFDVDYIKILAQGGARTRNSPKRKRHALVDSFHIKQPRLN